MSSVAVARFFSDGNVACYILPVLWMTSFLYNGANGPESSTTLCFIKFARWRHRGRNLPSLTVEIDISANTGGGGDCQVAYKARYAFQVDDCFCLGTAPTQCHQVAIHTRKRHFVSPSAVASTRQIRTKMCGLLGHPVTCKD